MADPYIDYFETREYTDYFVTTAKPLIGLSKIIDVAELCVLIGSRADAIDAELAKQGIKRSGVRTDRKDVETKAGALCTTIVKFYNYLNSLDDDVVFDMESFFPGGNQGTLSVLKPADLASRAGAILRGFEVEANLTLPEAETKKAKLAAARDALSEALGGKGSTVLASIKSTAELVAAREAWLNDYGAAKRIIQGLLALLRRKDDYRLYFKDLQVNEGGGGTSTAANQEPPPKQEPPPQESPEAKAPEES